jgi:hypothetical protein
MRDVSVRTATGLTASSVASVTLPTFPRFANQGPRSITPLSRYFSMKDDELSDPLSICGQRKKILLAMASSLEE